MDNQITLSHKYRKSIGFRQKNLYKFTANLSFIRLILQYRSKMAELENE